MPPRQTIAAIATWHDKPETAGTAVAACRGDPIPASNNVCLRSFSSPRMTDNVPYFARWVVPEPQPVRSACVCLREHRNCLRPIDQTSLSCARRDPGVYSHYPATCTPLHHPGASQQASDSDVSTLSIPCFQSLHWEPKTAAGNPNKKQKTSHQRTDLLCNVGGAVWALDWCPTQGEALLYTISKTTVPPPTS